MLKIEINNLKKYYGDRTILNVHNLKIYSEEKIGLVGLNGCGKSTLMNIITENIFPEEGTVKIYGSWSYISQNTVSDKKEFLSGGEKTMLKINNAFVTKPDIILADEPTANLDISNIEKFKHKLKGFKGALIMVSHDRELLDYCCTSIWELEKGIIKAYKGNYTDYLNKKKSELERQQFEYSQFIKEKNKIQKAAMEIEGKSAAIRKAPKRMGNSEARLHKMGDQRAKATLDKSKKALKTRLERLEVKESPKDTEKIKLDFNNENVIYSRVVIEGTNIYKSFGKNIVIRNSDFKIFNNTRTAIVGNNGCGKSTLIKMILEDDEGIWVSKTARIGYLSQDLSILNENKSILDNVMETSNNDENFSRKVLWGLLFKGDDIYKKVSCLSGGEKIKAALAKIVLSDNNVLILDEPASCLDIYSIEALEKVLSEYRGTLIFVSHDLRFINKLATNLLILKENKIISFNGNYQAYMDKSKNKCDTSQVMLLENRMCEIIGRISMPRKKDNVQELNMEYEAILKQLKKMK